VRGQDPFARESVTPSRRIRPHR